MIAALLGWWDVRRHGPIVWHAYRSGEGYLRRHGDGFERRVMGMPAAKSDRRWRQKPQSAWGN